MCHLQKLKVNQMHGFQSTWQSRKMIVKNSLFDRRERVNVDSLLSFDGANQYAEFDCLPNTPLSRDEFSISGLGYFSPGFRQAIFASRGGGNNNEGFSIEVLSDGRLQAAIIGKIAIFAQLQSRSLFHFTFTRQGTNISLFVNGRLITSSVVNSLGGFTITTYRGLIGSVPGSDGNLTFFLNGGLNHIAFLNRTLTEAEIKYTHRHGGLLPESTHAACVAHYVADREGLVMWDVVEQYNYTRDNFNYNPSPGLDDETQWAPSQWELDGKMKIVNAGIDSGRGIVRTLIKNNWLTKQTIYKGSITVESVNGTLEVLIGNRPDIDSTYLTFTSPGTYQLYGNSGVSDDLWIRATNFSDVVISAFELYEEGQKNLIPYHANLVNFTPAQVEGSGQSAYVDFYTKQIESYLGYQVGRAATRINSVSLTGVVDSGSSFTMFVEFEYKLINNQTQFLAHSAYQGNQSTGFMQLVNNQLYIFGKNGLGEATDIFLAEGRAYLVGLSFRSTDRLAHVVAFERIGSVYKLVGSATKTIPSPWAYLTAYGNGQRIFVGRTNFSSATGINTVFSFALKASYSTENELAAFCKTTQNSHFHYHFYPSGAVADRSGNGNDGSISYDANNTLASQDYYREKSSLLPPLINALRFDASQNQYASVSGFNPTKEKGYTIVMAIQRDGIVSSTEHLFSMNVAKFRAYLIPTGIGFSNSTGVRGGGNAVYNVTPDVSNITLLCFTVRQIDQGVDAFTQIFLNGRLVVQGGSTGTYVGFDELSGTLNIGRNTGADDFDGNILSFGIAKGIITPRQVLEMWNNSLLANPKASWKNLEWQLLPNFNQINDNAGTYTLTDLSPQNHTINLSGFTAPNLDPVDPAYALTEINALR